MFDGDGMVKRYLVLWVLFLSVSMTAVGEQVVLLHGLVRSPKSMVKLERALAEEGYDVFNIGYPSRQGSVVELAQGVRKEIEDRVDASKPMHFVTHSMGGILVRQLLSWESLRGIGVLTGYCR